MSKFDHIYRDFMPKLVHNLPPHLTYHNVAHTKYVIEKAITIGEEENLSEPDLELLKIAALFHDIGYIDKSNNHEEIGCEMVRNNLGKYGLDNREIEKICGMIMATKIPQKPNNLLEKILADADLEYLGTDSYATISKGLYQEILYFNPSLTKQYWIEIQIDFLSKHHFHTDFCINHREPVKQHHLEKLIQLFEKEYK
jgi:uncharacterized protein